MADWSNPKITSNYVTFVDEVKNRDIDAITLTRVAITGPPLGSIKLLRAPVAFQEYDGSVYTTLLLSLDGGGTGAGTPVAARTNLGLGTMATQNSNAVAITGGNIGSVTMSGNIVYNGGAFRMNAGGAQEALTLQGVATKYALYVAGGPAPSFGVVIRAGTSRTDVALAVENAVINRGSFYVWGDMVAQFMYRLVIPVGVDAYAPTT